MTQQTQQSTSLLARTALAIYEASTPLNGKQTPPQFDSLHPAERSRYERMAVAALTVAYMEPVALTTT